MPDDRKRDGGGRGGLDPPRLRVANSDDPPRLQSPDSDLDLSLGLCPPLTAALSWGETPAPYVSTVDVDAIKVSEAPILREINAPLTTIAENWESSVAVTNDRTASKPETVEDSSSGSETEGVSGSDSDSEETSSSSCSSLESDSSSDNEENKKYDEGTFRIGQLSDARQRNHSGSDPGARKRIRRRSGFPKHDQSPNRSPGSPGRTRRRSGVVKGLQSPLRRGISPLTRAHEEHNPVINNPEPDPTRFKSIKGEIHNKIFGKIEPESSRLNPTCDTSDISGDIKLRDISLNPESEPKPLESSDSDDSCIILDNVTKPQHLLLEPEPSIFLDEQYTHKKDLIYAAYGRSQSRQQENNDKINPETGIKAPDLSESSESSSDSLSSCETSQDEVQDVEMDPIPNLHVENSSSDEFSSLPPTLEPAMPNLAQTDANDISKSNLSTNEFDSNFRVECASQTVESGFPYIPASLEVPVPKIAPPPVLHGIETQSRNMNRGRPRKNPPMLKPQIVTNESSEEEEEKDVEKVKSKKLRKKLPAHSKESSDNDLSNENETENVKRIRKKDKLSVLVSLAKHTKRKEAKELSRSHDDLLSRFVNQEQDLSDSELSLEEISEKRNKLTKKVREHRRDKHSKSKVQKSHKHKGERHSKTLKERRKSKKQKRKLENEKDFRSIFDLEDTVKSKRHKDRRERKKPRKDSCYDCDDFTKKSRRPASAEETFKSSKYRSSFHKRTKRSESREILSSIFNSRDKERSSSQNDILKRPSSKTETKRPKSRTEVTSRPSSKNETKKRPMSRTEMTKRPSSQIETMQPFTMETTKPAFFLDSRHSSSLTDIVQRPSSRSEVGKIDAKHSEVVNSKNKLNESQGVEESRPFSRESLRTPTDVVENNFLSLFTGKPDQEMKNHFLNSDSNSVLLFPKKFCSMKPDRFWKKSRRKVVVEEKVDLEPTPSTPAVGTGTGAGGTGKTEPIGSVFATKASVKELPSSQFSPGNQVQQMLQVLAATASSSTKPKRKKERRAEEKERGDGDRMEKDRMDKEYETMSEDDESLGSRRRRRGWKSKHKNVIDPVFLGELEHLMQDLASCQLEQKISLDLWPDRPSNSMPSIFKRRKILVSRRKRDQGKIGKKIKTPRNSSHEKTGGSRDPEQDGTDEQRLPLKKRHHHLQGAGAQKEVDEIEIEIEIGTISPTSSPEKPSSNSSVAGVENLEPGFRSEQRSPARTRAENSSPRLKSKPGDFLSPSKLPAGQKPTELISEISSSCRKLTVADRMLEKLGMQVKKGVQSSTEICLTPEQKKPEVSWPVFTVEDEKLSSAPKKEEWKEKEKIEEKMEKKSDRQSSSGSKDHNSRTLSFRDSFSNGKKDGFEEIHSHRFNPGQETSLGARTKSSDRRTNSPRSKSQHSRCETQEERRSRDHKTSQDGTKSKISESRSNPSRSADRRRGSPDMIRNKNKVGSVVSWDKWKHQERTTEPSGSTFVDNIKDCIDKYTFVDEDEESPFSRLPRRYLGSAPGQRKSGTKQLPSPSGESKSVPIFSSPEPESRHELNTSGRESSLSHTSNSSESLSSHPEPTEGPAYLNKPGSYLGRASRQDLHNHLWREEKYKHNKSHGIQSDGANIPNQSNLYPTISNQSSKHTTDIKLQMSKPLPTEPIRRVDLGFSHKPLDKSMRFHRGQECYIKKVPQAIVAPFRRNPPETPAHTVTPIHRASIATAGMSFPVPTSLSSTANSTNTEPAPLLEPILENEIRKENEKTDKPGESKTSLHVEPTNHVPENMNIHIPEDSNVQVSEEHKAEENSVKTAQVSFPKTRSRDVKSNPDTEPTGMGYLKTSVVERMTKCQVEVCRLKEEDKSEQNTSESIKEEKKRSVDIKNKEKKTIDSSYKEDSIPREGLRRDKRVKEIQSKNLETSTKETKFSELPAVDLQNQEENGKLEISVKHKKEKMIKNRRESRGISSKEQKEQSENVKEFCLRERKITETENTEHSGRERRLVDKRKGESSSEVKTPVPEKNEEPLRRKRNSSEPSKKLDSEKPQRDRRSVEDQQKDSKMRERRTTNALVKDELSHRERRSVSLKDNSASHLPRERRTMKDEKEKLAQVVEHKLEKDNVESKEVSGEVVKKQVLNREGRDSPEVLEKKIELKDKLVENPPTQNKKRKRRPNKTGFPTKTKKKKPRLEKIADKITKSTEDSKPEKIVTPVTPDVVANVISMDRNENTESPEIEQFQNREKQLQVSRFKEQMESSLCRELENKLETKLKRNFETSNPSKDRSIKRLKLSKKPCSNSVVPSTSSSVNPSPYSSDVESTDSRLNWEDESDQDLLSVLPPSDESFSSPNPERKKKKKKGNIRKTYLKAGLFSYDYKSVVNQSSETEVGSRLKGMIYKPEEHPFSLLPPPYYCGRQLRQKKEDFTLPFDIWSLYSSKAIPTRDVLATWNYKRIKNNIYYDVKPGVNYESPVCHCKFPSDPISLGCTDDCINRMTYTECDPAFCNLGDRCSNLSIQKHLSPAVVERFMTEEKGWGIQTKTGIPAGTFIMEYLGEVVTDKEFKRRMHTDYQKDSHHYCLHLGEGLVIDGHRMGGECRFVNHSCKPNCEMQKWFVNGVYRMGLFSLKTLQPDEELTYDYNFSLFNPHEGQTCRCGMPECRGVIGGKSQRVKVIPKLSTQKMLKKDDKKKDKDKIEKISKPVRVEQSEKEMGAGEEELMISSIPVLIPVKEMDGGEREFCRVHSVLLPRNLEKIRKLRERYLSKVNHSQSHSTSQYKDSNIRPEIGQKSSQLRSEQTRRNISGSNISDPSKLSQLATCFANILSSLQSLMDRDGENIIKFFRNLPSKEQMPEYYLTVSEPIDISSIEKTLNFKLYSSVSQFNHDMLLLFQNNFRFYGNTHPVGKTALTLRSKYLNLCGELYKSLSESVGSEGTEYSGKADSSVPEDEIGCPCKQYKDEGVMIQCENCSVWQHLDCVRPGLDPDTLDKYNCDICTGAKPILDIPLVPQPEYDPGEVYYVSLQREDNLQVTLGMTVYVLRAFKDKNSLAGGESAGVNDEKIFTGPGGVPHKSISPIKGPSKEAASLAPGSYPTYRTVGVNASTQDMDIFRVERLWKNKSGAMFAFGYHYLRPHETFHEPTRRFFDNEVFRVPLYEVLPLDTIWRECWVMDPISFCRGRPLASQEEHVYICEYRVDKTARLFNKISKPKHGVCTKYFAFHNFDLRLRISRTFTPHDVPEKWAKNTGKSREFSAEKEPKKKNKEDGKKRKTNKIEKERRKDSLSQLLVNLLTNQADTNPTDASYLLRRLESKPEPEENGMMQGRRRTRDELVDKEEERGKGMRSKGRKSPNPDLKEKKIKSERTSLILVNLRDETRLDEGSLEEFK